MESARWDLLNCTAEPRSIFKNNEITYLLRLIFPPEIGKEIPNPLPPSDAVRKQRNIFLRIFSF